MSPSSELLVSFNNIEFHGLIIHLVEIISLRFSLYIRNNTLYVFLICSLCYVVTCVFMIGNFIGYRVKTYKRDRFF